MKRSNLLTLALASLLAAAIGCGTDRSPVSYEDPAETAPPSGRHFIAFSSAAAEAAGKVAAIPEEGVSISDWFGYAGGKFDIAEPNGHGHADDLEVGFWVPVGAVGGTNAADPFAPTDTAADSVYITMTVYGNTLSTLIVEFEPDGFEFVIPALLGLRLGWDLVDMDLDDLVVWHIHGDGTAEPAEIEIIKSDRNATILVDVPGFSKYSGGGGT